MTFQSCGEKHDPIKVTVFRTKKSSYDKYINKESLVKGQQPNLSIAKTLYNDSYPIELALYSNNKFYYNLPTLGDGQGTYEYKDGYYYLFAERTLFDMHIDLKAASEDASSLILKFTDRHGPRTLKLKNNL